MLLAGIPDASARYSSNNGVELHEEQTNSYFYRLSFRIQKFTMLANSILFNYYQPALF